MSLSRGGRRSDERRALEEQAVTVPAPIMQFLFGPDSSKIKMTKQEMASRLDQTIIENVQRIKDQQTLVALALWAVKSTDAFRHNGYNSWEQYISALVVRYQSFSTRRQADRYVAAVDIWLIRLRYDLSVMIKYGPSVLGEIAESGVLKSKREGDAWLRLIQCRTSSELRHELQSARQLLLDTPQSEQPMAEFGESEAAGREPPIETELEDPARPARSPVDELTVTVVEVRTPSGNAFVTLLTRGDGSVVGKYPSLRVKVVRKDETEASEFRKELRNMNIEAELTGKEPDE